MTDLWTAESGDGPLLVLVHGSLDRSAGLLKLSRRLDERFRVLRYDRRGYGRSVAHPGPYDMRGNVADLTAIIEGADAGTAVVIGHSYGGNVALAVAQHRPDLVRGVVVYESPQSWQPWWSDGSAGSHALESRDDPGVAAERFMRRLVGDDRWKRLPLATRDARRAEGRAMVGELGDLRDHSPWQADRIGVPVLVLYGEHGQPHHREGALRLRDDLVQAELHEVEGARHFGPNTHPDAVAALVVDFVDRRLSP